MTTDPFLQAQVLWEVLDRVIKHDRVTRDPIFEDPDEEEDTEEADEEEQSGIKIFWVVRHYTDYLSGKITLDEYRQTPDDGPFRRC